MTLIKDDTADHGILTSGSGSDTSVVAPARSSGSSAEVPASQSDSDFDLNPSSELIDALQPDSGSDFELSALDASDEFESTPLSKASDSDVTAADPNLSGINLSRPSDSGINLQAASGLGLGHADSIELAPLSDEDIQTSAGKPAKSAKPAAPKKSLSATPPPAVKKGEKDIFDDTDFEVDVPLSDDDSDDKTVQLEAASDFELEESDSGSEVFAIDEEAVDQNAATAMAPSAFAEDDEDEDDDGFDAAVSSEMTSGWSGSDSASVGAERAAPAMVLSRDAEAEWSGLWVGLLGVSTVLLMIVSFISYDLMRQPLRIPRRRAGLRSGQSYRRPVRRLIAGSPSARGPSASRDRSGAHRDRCGSARLHRPCGVTRGWSVRQRETRGPMEGPDGTRFANDRSRKEAERMVRCLPPRPELSGPRPAALRLRPPSRLRDRAALADGRVPEAQPAPPNRKRTAEGPGARPCRARTGITPIARSTTCAD